MLEFFSTCKINDTKMGLDTTDTLCFQLGEDRHNMTRRHDERRKRGARFFGEYFVGRLVDHFKLVSEEGFQELNVVVGELRMIDMDELQATAARALEDVEGAHAEDEGVLANPTFVHAPQPPPAAALVVRTMP
ncbi:hypothetical protein Tco_0035767 [Tanacetum coccineum]